MFLALLTTAALGLAAPPSLCEAARAPLTTALSRLHGVAALGRVGPYLSAEALRPFLVARSDELGAYLAVGRSRHAAALRLLRSPPAEGNPIGRGLGLLALGDPAQMELLKTTLKRGPVELRRALATALAALPQNRPRMVLYPAMGDSDPEVRLTSAEVMLLRGSRRAVNTLRALSVVPAFRVRAIDALLGMHALSRRDGARLGLPWSATVEARALWPITRRGIRRLPRKLSTGDRAKRAGVWAVIAATGEFSPLTLLKLARRNVHRYGGEVRQEAVMARLLSGEAGALGAGALTPAAARVLLAFGALPRRELDERSATAIAHALDAAIRARSLKPQVVRRVLSLIDAAHPPAAVWLARRLLIRSPEPLLLQQVVELLGKAGAAQDLPRLLGKLGKADPPLASRLYVAISELCARQP